MQLKKQRKISQKICWYFNVAQLDASLAVNNSCAWIGLSRPTTGIHTNGSDWVWTNGAPIRSNIFPWEGDQIGDPMGTYAYIYYGNDWKYHIGQSTQLSNAGCSVWCATTAGFIFETLKIEFTAKLD